VNRRALGIVAFAGAIATVACATGPDPRQALDDSVRLFNSDLRWQRDNQAAGHMAPVAQEPFLQSRDSIDKNFEIDDLEVVRVDADPSGQSALARVDVSWDRKNEGIVHTSSLRERWDRQGDGSWIVGHIELTDGDPLPLLEDAGPLVAPSSAPASSP
jgi:hypothetical protein